MNCHECKHSKLAPFSGHHKECCHPILGDNLVKTIIILQPSILNGVIKTNQHGVNNGWCNFPLDFDQIWIEDCKLFEAKNDKVPLQQV